MIAGPATVLAGLGAATSALVQAWLPALGEVGAADTRAVAAMVLVLASVAVVGVLLLAVGRALRSLVRPAWQEAAGAILPSLRLIAAVVVVAISLAPFLWPAPSSQAAEAAPTLAAQVVAWLALAILIIASGNLLFRLVHACGLVAMERARSSASSWDDVLVEVAVRVALGFILIGTVYVAVAVLADHPRLTEATSHLLGLLVIALVSWALVNLVHLVDRFLMTRYRAPGGDNLSGRRVATQVVVLKRMAYVVIGIFSLSTALMQFEAIRHVGASILASAGLAGIVLGLATQRTLANLLAGMQIALTQPLRIGDAVIIENEFGKVEEITLTYVVIGVWDQRRLIVPLSRVIENPFQNWTRTSSQLLGTVLLRVDFTLRLGDLRAEAKRYVEGHRLWDRRTFAVQVTDCDHRSMEVRVLVSAADAGALFDLRCEVREHLLDWLGRTHPQSLPHLVLGQAEAQAPAPVPAPVG